MCLITITFAPGKDSSHGWRTRLTLPCLPQATARALGGGAGLDHRTVACKYFYESLRCAHEACFTESPASVCQALRLIPFSVKRIGVLGVLTGPRPCDNAQPGIVTKEHIRALEWAVHVGGSPVERPGWLPFG